MTPDYLLASAAAAVVGGAALHWLRFPSGALIGAMIGAAAVRLAWDGPASDIPYAFRATAFLLIGWGMGGMMTAQAVRALLATARVVVVGAAVLLAAGGAVAGLLHWLAGTDLVTAILAAAPGGVSHMGAMSVDLEANTMFVVAFHLLRVLTVLFGAPLLLRGAVRRHRRE